MIRQLKAVFLFLLLTLILHFGGCGGKGNGPGGGPPSAAAPTVLSTTPPDGASFSGGNAITATFSKEMDPASLNPTTFKISGLTGTVTASGKTASFIPAVALSQPAAYTATITQDAKDLDGNRLPSNYVWRFTAGSGSGPPVLSVSPPSLAFLAAAGGPLPSPQGLTLSPAGGGNFKGSIKTDAPWLSEWPSSGTNPNRVTVSITTTDLPPGTYRGTVTIASSGGLQSAVPVSYVLTDSAPSASCPGPVRSPYLAFDTPTSATIAWECAPQGVVEWGTDASFGHRLEDSAEGNKHFATLSSLSPDTRYFYRVTASGGLLGQGSFTTAKSAEDNDFSFVAFADSGSGSPAQWALASLMQRLSFSFAIIAGDVVYESGAESEFDPHYFIPYQPLIGHLPFFPVAGNHDVHLDNGVTFMTNFYHPTGRLYYDFHWGDAHFINFDSTHADDPDQRDWVEQTLSSSTSLWKIVYFHHPAYSSGVYGGYPFIQNHFVPLFEKYQVDLVITGHDHDYERTEPINGVTYLVTGGGGAGTQPVGQSGFTAFSQSIHHLIQANMSGRTLSLNALDSNGNVFDSAVLKK